jgi:predicted O-linked N-acetylglucosamine transferase (SPINDLY family)
MNTSGNHISRQTVRATAGNAESPESHYAQGRSLILAGDLGRGWVHLLRGWALRQCNRLDEAVVSLEQALRLQPELPQALSEALLCYAWMCDWTAFERMVARLRRIPGVLANVETSSVLMFSDDPAEHAIAARAQAAQAAGGKAPMPLPRRYGHGRIRIAYLSHDFHAHATAFLMAELFELHCSGRSFPARVAGSLLHAVGLEELVTNSLAGYETLAIELAGDKQRLSAMRAHLTAERERLPLFDTPRFCRHLERAYRYMWQRHRDGQPAVTFRVEPIAAPGGAR